MDKAVILAGGKGLRFGSDANDVPKPMAEVCGKPLIHYIVSMLKGLGFKKLYVVVAYKKEVIIDYLSGGRYGLDFEFIDNSNINNLVKSGLSDAVLLLKEKIKEPFMTILGDEIYAGTSHKAMIEKYESGAGYSSVIAVHRAKDIEEVKKNYSVMTDKSGLIVDLEEKPQKPWNDLIGCGTYIFDSEIFGYIEKTPVSARSGRKELADTMKLMIRDNKKIFAFDIAGQYLNINYPEDIARACAIMGAK